MYPFSKVDNETQKHTMPDTQTLIDKLNLQPHPEGGWFRETYRCAQMIDCEGVDDPRNCSTAIYYLLGGRDISRFHRIKSDEVWHHYEGSTLTIHVIHLNGLYQELLLGKNPEAGEAFQHVVPAGCWFGATVNNPEGFSLVGCTVSPGFDFRDFEMAEREQLLEEYPQLEKIIKKLT